MKAICLPEQIILLDVFFQKRAIPVKVNVTAQIPAEVDLNVFDPVNFRQECRNA